jgi:hypothetical protein
MGLESSLRWIVGILHEQRIPFVVTGGFAAHLYGSGRPVNDIDLDIPTRDLSRIAPFVQEFIAFGPSHYLNEAWDLTLLNLDHAGQEIDISGADSIRIYDPRSSRWVDSRTDLGDHTVMDVFGVRLPVASPRALLYKEMLAAWGHQHQRTDVEAIRKRLIR